MISPRISKGLTRGTQCAKLVSSNERGSYDGIASGYQGQVLRTYELPGAASRSESREVGEDIPAQSIKVSWEYGLDPAANVEAAANAFLDRFVNVDGSRGARAKIAVAFDGDYYVSWGWVDDAGKWL